MCVSKHRHTHPHPMPLPYSVVFNSQLPSGPPLYYFGQTQRYITTTNPFWNDTDWLTFELRSKDITALMWGLTLGRELYTSLDNYWHGWFPRANIIRSEIGGLCGQRVLSLLQWMAGVGGRQRRREVICLYPSLRPLSRTEAWLCEACHTIKVFKGIKRISGLNKVVFLDWLCLPCLLPFTNQVNVLKCQTTNRKKHTEIVWRVKVTCGPMTWKVSSACTQVISRGSDPDTWHSSRHVWCERDRRKKKTIQWRCCWFMEVVLNK